MKVGHGHPSVQMFLDKIRVLPNLGFDKKRKVGFCFYPFHRGLSHAKERSMYVATQCPIPEKASYVTWAFGHQHGVRASSTHNFVSKYHDKYVKTESVTLRTASRFVYEVSNIYSFFTRLNFLGLTLLFNVKVIVCVEYEGTLDESLQLRIRVITFSCRLVVFLDWVLGEVQVSMDVSF